MSKNKKKILIVEDEAPLRQAISDKFKRGGFTTLEAKDGSEGLDAALKEHPDLIILDLIMPKTDGLSMLKELRGDDWGKEVPVIILTNLSDAENVAKAMEKGVYDFLVKSDWKLEDLIKRVKDKLGIL
ncbi:response regulator [Patescibacteria group bacterium]|nr:response regulator [Patescibacteria group bacterium]